MKKKLEIFNALQKQNVPVPLNILKALGPNKKTMQNVMENWRRFLKENKISFIEELISAVKTTLYSADEEYENWSGNFLSMITIYKRYLSKGKDDKAKSFLKQINNAMYGNKPHDEWIAEFIDPTLAEKWRSIENEINT
tara:strand:- start:1266 stop:1682 length:417 start_codon:yes stop_codon:yes gene_type:complete